LQFYRLHERLFHGTQTSPNSYIRSFELFLLPIEPFFKMHVFYELDFFERKSMK
jgi:hypothetical protein